MDERPMPSIENFLANLGQGCGEKQRLRQLSPAPPLLAANVRRMRLERGWSALALASKVGVCEGTIWKVEKGRNVGRRVLVGLCRALGVTMTQLTGIEEASMETQHES